MPTFVTNDGVTLSYLDEGDGPVVVLVGGYAAPAVAWALTQDALVDAGYRVIAWDRRSHGDSESPLFGQRMSRHGADLNDLLLHLGARNVVLVGASMGGNAVWAYVDLFGTERVRGIVILDQTPKMLNSDGWEYGFYGYTSENAGTYFANGIPDTGRGQRIEESMPGVQKLVERLGGMPPRRDPVAPETIHLLADHALQDWRDVIARTTVPFLMVAARESQVWPCEHAAAAVSDNPHGSSVIIEHAGHALNFANATDVNAVLLPFLASLAG